MSEQELKEYYHNIEMLSPGYSCKYKGYTLQKIKIDSPTASPNHGEVYVLNRQNNHVETLGVITFDNFEEFKTKLDEIINYNPEDLDDWLNREQ